MTNTSLADTSPTPRKLIQNPFQPKYTIFEMKDVTKNITQPCFLLSDKLKNICVKEKTKNVFLLEIT